MAIENSVSNDFLSTFVDCIDVFDYRLPSGSLESLHNHLAATLHVNVR